MLFYTTPHPTPHPTPPHHTTHRAMWMYVWLSILWTHQLSLLAVTMLFHTTPHPTPHTPHHPTTPHHTQSNVNVCMAIYPVDTSTITPCSDHVIPHHTTHRAMWMYVWLSILWTQQLSLLAVTMLFYTTPHHTPHHTTPHTEQCECIAVFILWTQQLSLLAVIREREGRRDGMG